MEGAVKLLPGPQQRRLLRVAVLDDDTATQEWERWRAGGGTLDDLDNRSQALLPLLYRRLNAMGVDDPDMARLKGTYRHRWCENVDALRAGRAALSILAAAGTGAMVFKGAALMIAYGRDPGARPMGDVDLVVRPGEARAALELLLNAGFRSVDNIDPVGALRVRRGINLSVPDMEGKQVDLHWSTLPAPAGGDDVFDRGRHTTLLGLPTLVPSPTDLLLSIITHGTNWYPEPVRWVLDSCYILSTQPGEVDWDLLVAQARRHRYAWPVGLALDALQRDYGAAVPPCVARSLLSTQGDVVERAMWRAQRNLPQRGVRYPFLLNEWLRARRQPYPGGPAGGLLSFLEEHLEASGPLDLVRKLWPQLPAH
jgi:hypothetical protein